MPQKPRHLKTAIQLWVMDNRKAQSETSADLARLTGVTVDTARGWESRGGPSEDAIRILEAHWGKPAPRAGGEATPPPADLSELRDALMSQAESMARLLQFAIRRDQSVEARIRAMEAELESLRGRLGAEASPGQSTPPQTGGSAG